MKNLKDWYRFDYYEKEYKLFSWLDYREKLAEAIRFGMPGKILDIGAGAGFFLECCQRFGLNAVGVEWSKDAIEIANKRYKIKIINHSLESFLPFKKEIFSIIMFHQVIEHLEPHIVKQTLLESYRVLLKGGIILVYSPSYSYRKNRVDKTHINLYNPSSLRKEIEDSGFKIISELNWAKPYLGDNKYGRLIMKGMLKLFPLDIFSASANCIACKI